MAIRVLFVPLRCLCILFYYVLECFGGSGFEVNLVRLCFNSQTSSLQETEGVNIIFEPQIERHSFPRSSDVLDGPNVLIQFAFKSYYGVLLFFGRKIVELESEMILNIGFSFYIAQAIVAFPIRARRMGVTMVIAFFVVLLPAAARRLTGFVPVVRF